MWCPANPSYVNRKTVIEPLTSRQRTHLRSLAHPLKPTVHVGKAGVTAAAVDNVRDAFARKELIKVKVLEAAPDDPREAAASLAEQVGDTHIVQVLGRTATLYRPHPDRPEIRLPR